MRQESSRPALRRATSVALSGAGFGYSMMVCSPVAVSRVATVARVRPQVHSGAHSRLGER